MGRETCSNCKKPFKRCICPLITPINNIKTVIILQHSKETKHPFSTLPIVESSLENCHIFIGEDFKETENLHSLLKRLKVWVIFPSTNAEILNDQIHSLPASEMPNALLFIDGTWKKAKKIWYINEFLHDLPQCMLDLKQASKYQIRRSRFENSLSLVEAVYESMSLLEPMTSFDCLMEAFDAMVKQQLALEHEHKP